MACNFISKKVAKILLWISLIVLIVSITVIILFPSIYNSELKKEVSLGKGSLLSGIWKDIPIPIYERLYFFNISNKEQFLSGTEPLDVTEVGPYTYKSRWVKNDPVWNSNNTVSYRETRTYQFVPGMSNGTQEDEVYTLNGPLLIAASMSKDYDEILRALLSTALAIEGETVIIKKKIRELVYDGYEDFIIKYATLIKPNIPFKSGVFSWLYGKNATDDGLFTVFTGVDDPSKTDIINNWNGEERLPFWKGDTCNMLNGTSIEIGPPIHGSQDSYTFFQSIFCRSLTFNYTEDLDHYGVASKRFRPTYSLFANRSENPDNYCFEIEKERPSGLLDASPCQFGAPVFISFPHFHLADPSYLRSVVGLDPDDEKHGSVLDIEPITGLTIYVVLRFQINVEITKVTGIFQTYKPTKGVFPIFWVELNLEINEDLADFLKSKTRNPKIISYSVLGGLAAVSLVIAIVCFVVLYSSSSDDDDDPLLDAKGDNYSPYYDTLPRDEESCEKEDRKEGHEKYDSSSEHTKNDLSNDVPPESPKKR